MFKQLLPLMFLITQYSMVFAAIPDISGTYSGIASGSEVCIDTLTGDTEETDIKEVSGAKYEEKAKDKRCGL
jgi:hypothetical protein